MQLSWWARSVDLLHGPWGPMLPIKLYLGTLKALFLPKVISPFSEFSWFFNWLCASHINTIRGHHTFLIEVQWAFSTWGPTWSLSQPLSSAAHCSMRLTINNTQISERDCTPVKSYLEMLRFMGEGLWRQLSWESAFLVSWGPEFDPQNKAGHDRDCSPSNWKMGTVGSLVLTGQLDGFQISERVCLKKQSGWLLRNNSWVTLPSLHEHT